MARRHHPENPFVSPVEPITPPTKAHHPDNPFVKREAAPAAPVAAPESAGGESPSVLDGIARLVMQGVTIGHTDELSGAAKVVDDKVGALFSGTPAPSASESYAKGRAEFNADLDQFRASNPWTARVSEAAGSVMLDPLAVAANAGRTALARGAAQSGAVGGLANALLRAGQAVAASPVGRAVLGGSMTARAARGATVGSAYGAAAGAGYAEPGHRTEGAATGALIGAGVGSAAPAVVAGVARATESAGARAANLVTRALERGGTTPRDLATRVQAGAVGHAPEVLADLGGDQTRRLADYASLKPSAGGERLTDFLETRALDRGTRLSQAAEQALGAPRGNVAETQGALETARKARADHLYGIARNTPPVDDPAVLQAIADDEVLRDAAERARRMVERETGQSQPPLVSVTRDAQGNEVRTLNPQSVAVLDLLKKGGDDVIQTGLEGRKKIGQNEARVSLQKLHGLLDRLDQARPEYAAARRQFADDMALEDALAAGGRAFSAGAMPEQVAQEFAATPPAAQSFYRQGAARQLYGATEGVDPGGVRSLNYFRRPVVQQKVDALATDATARQGFRDAVGRERGMARTEAQVLKNSRTANRLETIRDVEGGGLVGALQGAAQAVRSPVSAALGAAGRIAAGVNERTANSLAESLLSGANGRGELVATLERIANDATASATQRAEAERALRTIFAPRAAAANAQ